MNDIPWNDLMPLDPEDNLPEDSDSIWDDNTDLSWDDGQDIGFPEDFSGYWHYQGDSQDCALYAQGGILEAAGQEFDIEKFQQQGIDGGWYDPVDGTDLDHMGDLLLENGIPATYTEGASVDDLADALKDGRGVVVAVDCLPIWGEPGGHALWITGIEVDEEGNPTNIICNDSGRDDGQRIAYPLEDFQQSWDWFGNRMVMTNSPLPRPSV